MKSYIICCRNSGELMRECVEKSYGHIRYELPFIGALCVDVPEENTAAVLKLRGITAATEDMKVTKFDAQESSKPCMVNAEADSLGRGVSIAVLDTGTHPHYDLIKPYNRLLVFKDFVNSRTVPYDDDGHGTHVSGIAAGNGFSGAPKGIAPEASIVSLKVLDSDGSGNVSGILAAMQWICDNHRKYNIRVVNLSLGMTYDDSVRIDPLHLGVGALYKSGITVVAAGGNSGPAAKTISSPGNSPYVITAGCCGTSEVSEFSSRGPAGTYMKPDLVAYGEDICSLAPGKTATATQSGTSMSAPVVSGAAACLYSAYPQLTAYQVKRILMSATIPFEQEDRNSQGYGRLDADMLKELI